jgi:mRNA interferase MazF
VRRGEIWWAVLPAPWGRRPVLLVARNEAYAILKSVMVAPLTTTIRRIPTTVILDPVVDGVPQPCVVSLDNVQAIQIARLESMLVRLRPERMAAVDRAIHFAFGLRH